MVLGQYRYKTEHISIQTLHGIVFFSCSYLSYLSMPSSLSTWNQQYNQRPTIHVLIMTNSLLHTCHWKNNTICQSEMHLDF